MKKEVKVLKDALNKKFGVGTVPDKVDYTGEVIPSGSIGLDKALGIGGWPLGRIVEIFGWESVGKTTLAQHAIAEAQHLNKICAFIDAEHAIDKGYSEAIGIDWENLLLTQPGSGEEALEEVDFLIDKVDLIVVDSVAALTPKAEIEGAMGDSVTFDTPVYIRNRKTKLIEIVPIASLYEGAKEFYDKRHCNKYIRTKNIEVLSASGWTALEAVFFKQNSKNKKVHVVSTGNGYVKATKDHAFMVGGKEACFDELENDVDTVDVVSVSKAYEGLTESMAFVLGSWCGDGNIHRHTFSFTNTDISYINKLKDCLVNSFGVHVSIRKKDPKGNRKALYVLHTSVSETLNVLTDSCFCSKTLLYKVPSSVLNSSKDEVKSSFLRGFWLSDGNHKSIDGRKKYYNNGLPLLAGVQFLHASMNDSSSITFSKNRYKELTLSIGASKHSGVTRKFKTEEVPEFLYDIQTADGTFVTALGNIVLHNSKMGLHARLMSQAMRKLTAKSAKSDCTVMFMNQMRMKIGQVFGNPETTTGGNALKFYASLRVEVTRSVSKVNTLTNDDGDAMSNLTKIKVVKNKLAPPFKRAEFYITYGIGIDAVKEVKDYAIDLGIMKKSGSWFSYKGQKIAQGENKVLDFLTKREDIYYEIYEEVLSSRVLMLLWASVLF